MSDPSISVVRRRGFTVVYNDLLPDDGSLSARAWGLFVYLVGRPDGWDCRVSHLRTQFKEGRDAIYAALNELVTAGLMTKEDYVEGGLRRTRFAVDVDETRPTRSAPVPGNPDPGNQDPGNPEPGDQDPGNPDPEKAGQVSNDPPSTEGAKTTPRSARGDAATRTRGTRLPDDWWPSTELQDWYRQQPYATLLDPREVTEEFRRYWWAKAGQNATKISWDMTWQNWMSREGRNAGRPGGRTPTNVHHATDDPARAERIAAWDTPTGPRT